MHRLQVQVVLLHQTAQQGPVSAPSREQGAGARSPRVPQHHSPAVHGSSACLTGGTKAGVNPRTGWTPGAQVPPTPPPAPSGHARPSPCDFPSWGQEAPLGAGPRARGRQGALPPAVGRTHPLARMTPTTTMTRAKKQLALMPTSTTSSAMRASRLRPRLQSQWIPAAGTGAGRQGVVSPREDPRPPPTPWPPTGTGARWAGLDEEGPWRGWRWGRSSTCSRDQKGQARQAQGAAKQAGVRLRPGGHVQPPADHAPLDGTQGRR